MGFSISCLSQFHALQNVNQEMKTSVKCFVTADSTFDIGDVHILLDPTKQVHSLELDELCDSLSSLIASVNTCKIL